MNFVVVECDTVRLPLANLRTLTILKSDPRAGTSLGFNGVTVEQCYQRDGGSLWSVRSGSECYGAEGWEYEVQPSSRDASFFARCRYETLAEAVSAAMKAIEARP